jgi:urate oxidase
VVTGHPHAFWRDGAEKTFVKVELTRDGDDAVARVAARLRDLLGAQNLALFLRPFRWVHTHTQTLPPSLRRIGWYFYGTRSVVLKSTGSAFENFMRDEYMTLGEVDDRIFSTSVELKYAYLDRIGRGGALAAGRVTARFWETKL